MVRTLVRSYDRAHHRWVFRWVLRPAFKVQFLYKLNGRTVTETAYPRRDGRYSAILRIPVKGVLVQVRVFPNGHSARSLPAQPILLRPGVQTDNIFVTTRR